MLQGQNEISHFTGCSHCNETQIATIPRAGVRFKKTIIRVKLTS